MMSHPSPFTSAASRRPLPPLPRFSDTVFVHNEQDDDYSSFAPTQMADDELRPDAGLERRLQARRRDDPSSVAGMRAAEPLESALPRQAGPRRIESGALRAASSAGVGATSWTIAALLAAGVIGLLLMVH